MTDIDQLMHVANPGSTQQTYSNLESDAHAAAYSLSHSSREASCAPHQHERMSGSHEPSQTALHAISCKTVSTPFLYKLARA